MSLEIWITFTIASFALLAIPGPTVLLVVSYAIRQGKSSGWSTVPGVALGDLTAMTVSLVGAGAILTASSTLFTILKLAGAFYLIWLGFKMWREKPVLGDLQETNQKRTKMSMFLNAYIVTALNPKGIVFFIAFVPQFVNPELPVLMQFVVLETTFVILAAANVTVWALLAGEMRSKFQRPGVLKILSRTGGGFLIGAGLVTATIQE
ncbi:MAG: threonine/homoserine/homoserine lactone efflux protein [Parasphingorhabdus sp.]|jgi:threonine/homoserine/homoserine lactone efflux protein